MASRILIVDPVSASRILVSSLLQASHYELRTADDLITAAEMARDWPPEIVIVGLAGQAPAVVMEHMRDQGLWASNPGGPLVLFLDRDATRERRLEALASDARDLIATPVPDRLLLAHVRSLMREVIGQREVTRRKSAAVRFGFAEGPAQFETLDRVAIVCEGPGAGSTRQALHMAFGDRFSCVTPRDALANTNGEPSPGVFILDASGAEPRRGLDLLPELRTRDHSRHAGILVLHEPGARDVAEQALDGGASDIMASDALEQETVFRVKALFRRKAADDALRQSSEESLQLAATDPLTGLYNRRYADAYLADTIRSAPTRGEAVTIMLADIDHFKAINDKFGHAAGDEVLIEVASRLRDNLRAIDLVARFGGEEFLIVLPGTSDGLAEPAAERLRRLIGQSPVLLDDGRRIEVTMSIGVVVDDALSNLPPDIFPVPGENGSRALIRSLLERADQALYSAKTTGRNRVAISPSCV